LRITQLGKHRTDCDRADRNRKTTGVKFRIHSPELVAFLPQATAAIAAANESQHHALSAGLNEFGLMGTKIASQN
jgi:hypothetical protein